MGVVGGVEAHLDAVRIVEPDEHGSVDLLAASDDEPVAVLDRPWMQQVRTEPDAGKALSLWMGASRDIFARVAPIIWQASGRPIGSNGQSPTTSSPSSSQTKRGCARGSRWTGQPTSELRR